MIELALPAGSLSGALTALQNGADAVYFGLKDFSARKGAVNFSEEDLSKIRRYSLENGKKTYITINTLIDDESMPSLIDTLDMVEFYGTDGIIVQDLGVADIVRKYYPSIPLHASTQLAVHTTQGVKVLQDLGFERIVLSRELNLKEIEKIRRDCPDIEIKAFIHGALCYGFSGLCSASAIKCHRSANGGECAQICRSWFTDEETGKKGYFFSMEDMDAGEEILALDRMGIDSAKVEGRLKSPEYYAYVARYYRGILDRGYVDAKDRENAAVTFLRKSGDGYLNYKKDRPSLLSGGYPGHMGVRVGRIVKEEGNIRTIESDLNIESHDGLQYFNLDKNSLPVSEKFPANVVGKGRGYIKVKIDSRDRLLGKEVYKISDSTKKEKIQSTNIPLYRKPIDISVTLEKDRIIAKALGVEREKELMLNESKSEVMAEERIEKALKESGTSKYTLSTLSYTDNSGLNNPFIPPSLLKEFRRSFYDSLDKIEREKKTIKETKEMIKSISLPDRNLLSSDLPWSIEPKTIGDRTYITLPPVSFDEEKVWNMALRNVEGKENVTIGLNNIGQINFAKAHPEFSYFIDIWLYASNRFASLLFYENIPSLVGGYLWFERKQCPNNWIWKPSVTNFEPPYFISRTCYRHDALGEECKGCKGKYDYKLSQTPDYFTLKVRSCLTVLERNPEH